MMPRRDDGSKDRRRLPRKPDAEGARSARTMTKKNRPRSTDASGHGARSSPRSKQHQHQPPPRPSHKAAVQRTTPTPSRAAVANKAKPAASKKPKHLKRKLEQQAASSNVESGTAPANPVDAPSNNRDELVQQLQRWQEEKAAYLEKKQSKKRRKVSPATKVRDDHAGTKASLGSGHPPPTKSNVAFPRRNDVQVEPAPEPHGRPALDLSKPQGNPDRTRSRKVKPQREADSTVTPPQIDQLPATTERQQVVAPAAAAAAAAARVDNDGNNDSGDDHDDDPAPSLLMQKRERGKRRRGKKSNEVSTTATNSVIAGTNEATPQEHVDRETAQAATSDRVDQSNKNDDSQLLAAPHADKSSKKEDGRRYCVGRKPVTDYVVGQSYPGTVVYVKPFGIFLDIGCHSDAFCHVSRLSDDFVQDPTAEFKPGDAIEAARVVEVDRKGKRITVSLQSEARAADERQSIDARQERLRKRHKKGPALEDSARGQEHVSAQGEPTEPRAVSQDDQPKLKAKTIVASKPIDPARIQPDSGLTPQQQLKRARKLERRAARRSENDTAAP